ncbi:hypothetical protein HK100_005085 [Physocladia obscura]|uniref:Uncharacterized protein n=1 Tax=Physocladia obscura TaxID=109957 RepID=A0AAD5X9K0_9FUNG|nr:hypothetical protein HK100_005085 [Physocladia obscura]
MILITIELFDDESAVIHKSPLVKNSNDDGGVDSQQTASNNNMFMCNRRTRSVAWVSLHPRRIMSNRVFSSGFETVPHVPGKGDFYPSHLLKNASVSLRDQHQFSCLLIQVRRDPLLLIRAILK